MLVTPPALLSRYRGVGYPSQFNYRSKALALWQNLGGVDVLLYGVYVQEFGDDCALVRDGRGGGGAILYRRESYSGTVGSLGRLDGNHPRRRSRVAAVLAVSKRGGLGSPRACFPIMRRRPRCFPAATPAAQPPMRVPVVPGLGQVPRPAVAADGRLPRGAEAEAEACRGRARLKRVLPLR